MLESYPDVLTVKQVSDILQVSEKHVYNLIHDEVIPARRFGRIYRVSKQALLKLLT